MTEAFDALYERLKRDTLKAPKAEIIYNGVKSGAMKKDIGARKLQKLEEGQITFDEEDASSELSSIIDALTAEQQSIKNTFEAKFRIGAVMLPICIFFAFLYAFFSSYHDVDNMAAAIIIGSCLTSAAVYMYMALRVYQQGSFAAERLTEKKAGLHYLRLALENSGDDSKAYLKAGTAMFLNHQAPATLPLNHQDLPALPGQSAPQSTSTTP